MILRTKWATSNANICFTLSWKTCELNTTRGLKSKPASCTHLLKACKALLKTHHLNCRLSIWNSLSLWVNSSILNSMLSKFQTVIIRRLRKLSWKSLSPIWIRSNINLKGQKSDWPILLTTKLKTCSTCSAHESKEFRLPMIRPLHLFKPTSLRKLITQTNWFNNFLKHKSTNLMRWKSLLIITWNL